jgi:hypothetical protein
MSLPHDFVVNTYKLLNPDLNKNASDDEIKHHYLNYGKKEGRKYKFDNLVQIQNTEFKEENIPKNLPEIIGYIHVCQIGKWTIPFDMIMKSVRESGLYDNCREIRVGIVNDTGSVIQDERFNDPKIKIISYGASSSFERPTLHIMRQHAEIDNCQYWYAHTKGITHFDNNTFNLENILDWIKLMIYWNFTQWKKASSNLLKYDTCGCEYTTNPKPHYSGNFWWANSCYIRTLPKIIGPEYCDPEFWLLNRQKNLICNVYSSGLDGGDHYYHKSNFFK